MPRISSTPLVEALRVEWSVAGELVFKVLGADEDRAENDEKNRVKNGAVDGQKLWLGVLDTHAWQKRSARNERGDREARNAFLVGAIERVARFPTGSLAVDYLPSGQPVLSQGHWSLSHTEDCLVFAFQLDRPIGIDIEHSDRTGQIEKILARYQHKRAVGDFLEGVNDPVATWCFLEALGKRVGTGLKNIKQVLNSEMGQRAYAEKVRFTIGERLRGCVVR